MVNFITPIFHYALPRAEPQDDFRLVHYACDQEEHRGERSLATVLRHIHTVDGVAFRNVVVEKTGACHSLPGESTASRFLATNEGTYFLNEQDLRAQHPATSEGVGISLHESQHIKHADTRTQTGLDALAKIGRFCEDFHAGDKALHRAILFHFGSLTAFQRSLSHALQAAARLDAFRRTAPGHSAEALFIQLEQDPEKARALDAIFPDDGTVRQLTRFVRKLETPLLARAREAARLRRLGETPEEDASRKRQTTPATRAALRSPTADARAVEPLVHRLRHLAPQPLDAFTDYVRPLCELRADAGAVRQGTMEQAKALSRFMGRIAQDYAENASRHGMDGSERTAWNDGDHPLPSVRKAFIDEAIARKAENGGQRKAVRAGG